jgi:hypothetical protein
MATYYNGLELSINIFELGRSVCKNNKAVIQTSSSLGEIRSLYTASQGGSYFAYYNSAGKKIAEISNQDPKNFNKQYLAAHGAETALSVTCPHENAIAGKVANPLTLQDLMYKKLLYGNIRWI